ncbi:MAG: heme ABC transporter ATP-binding protein [Halobacteriaceae archaeon]
MNLPWTGDDPAPEAGAPAIELSGVTVDLGDQRALDGVSATVEAGRFVGLVGPNGAGKTTLLRTVTGALAPDAGTVRVRGVDVGALSSRAASRLVAAVPQDTSLAFEFDVRDVVAMGRTPYRDRLGGASGADREAVDEALDRTDTAALAERSVGEVSGGERQRVLLARALAQETPVLLLDEPTASLDINHQVHTLELVADLAGEGRTVVAAIHDLNLAAHYCDELLLLADGAVRAAGAPEAVLTESNLEAAFGTRAVVTRHPVTGSTYVTALPDAGEDAGRVHVVGGGGTASRLLYVLSAAGFAVSAGALNRGDTDLETARTLGAETVTVPPSAPVDGAAAAVRECVRAADVTVVADVEVGEGNLANLEAARDAGAVVIVEQRPFEERNFAGGEARAVYDDLCERGTVVEPREVLGTVSDLVGGGGGRAERTPAPGR